MKRLCLIISGAVSSLIFVVLLCIANHMAGEQSSQNMAERWSKEKDVAQISCFFSVGAYVSEDDIKEFEHTIDSALLEASISQESENPGARLWIDAYSADGKISIASDKTTLQAAAIGIGGDFFQFHPQQLLTGSYFSGNDLMQDYCVIDEDAAWQLFGSNDVAGQIVTIRGIPHIVTGVVRRPQGRLYKAAGLDATLVYVSYQTLSELGTNYGINHYEIAMPNPVKNFAFNHVKENIGVDEKNMEVLENTSRYSLLARFKTVAAFGTRSMNGKAIIYPYWENIARGYEDIIALLTAVMIPFLLYPIGLALTAFIKWWKHKGWTLKDVWKKGLDKWERFLEKQREKRLLKRKQETADL
ncbi:MAG: ABC transporter permease [Bacteroidales bacterium]|nr:ABC transporter permease [Lachnoclostridium sp.]MCM1383493.1 ABC transporter permease [Lachnoclostridium sp.]MCM1465361.1 ABC transporter permease [Bacteroidales bacterium]